MRKKTRKLRLERETLGRLHGGQVGQGSPTDGCAITDKFSECHLACIVRPAAPDLGPVGKSTP